jgi:hypothetical protein
VWGDFSWGGTVTGRLSSPTPNPQVINHIARLAEQQEARIRAEQERHRIFYEDPMPRRVTFPVLRQMTAALNEEDAVEAPYDRIEAHHRSQGVWELTLPSYNPADGAMWVDNFIRIHRGLEAHDREARRLTTAICSPRFYHTLQSGRRARVGYDVVRGPQSLVLAGVTIEPESACPDNQLYFVRPENHRDYVMSVRRGPSPVAPPPERRSRRRTFQAIFDDVYGPGIRDALQNQSCLRKRAVDADGSRQGYPRRRSRWITARWRPR